MGTSTEAAVLEALEQAEMDAREKRLAVSNEADAIVAAARQQATAISAQTSRRVDEALDELRRAAAADADAAVAVLERTAADRAGLDATDGGTDPRIDEAVALVVARVLGEVTTDGTRRERA